MVMCTFGFLTVLLYVESDNLKLTLEGSLVKCEPKVEEILRLTQLAQFEEFLQL